MYIDADRLTELIKNKYGSQAAFAKACGVSRQFVHQVIAGESHPSLPRLVQFAELLGVQPGELLNASPRREEDT